MDDTLIGDEVYIVRRRVAITYCAKPLVVRCCQTSPTSNSCGETTGAAGGLIICRSDRDRRESRHVEFGYFSTVNVDRK
jgi:hypothetical protein